MGYRAKVAHRRPAPDVKAAAAGVYPTMPPPASPEESAGPVVPLTGPAAPRPVSAPVTGVSVDGGAAGDAGAGTSTGG